MEKAKAILIVEDDKVIRETLKEILESEGYDIEAAGNGREALDLLNNGLRPDIILLDIMMPVMDGYQFRNEQLKDSSFSQIPTIVMSADHSFHQKENTLRFKRSLKKPIDLDDLLNIIDSFA